MSAYADQKFKEIDSDIVAGVLRKPFEVGELGNLIQLCVRGFEEATKDHPRRAPASEIETTEPAN